MHRDSLFRKGQHLHWKYTGLPERSELEYKKSYQTEHLFDLLGNTAHKTDRQTDGRRQWQMDRKIKTDLMLLKVKSPIMTVGQAVQLFSNICLYTTRFYSFFMRRNRLWCRRYVHCSETGGLVGGCLAAVCCHSCLTDWNLHSQRLLRGSSMSLADGVSGWNFECL